MNPLDSPQAMLTWLRDDRRGFVPDELAEYLAPRLPDSVEQLVELLRATNDPINTKAKVLSPYQAREILDGRGDELLVLDPAAFRARYILREPVRRGGQGSVYKAQNVMQATRRIIALKHMVSSTPQEDRRFRLEIEAYGAIGQHPNVAHYFDFLQTGSGSGYIETEFVEGHTLDVAVFSHIRTAGGVSVLQAFQWLEQIARGLGAAHRSPKQPVIHRDLKPNNLLLDFESLNVKLVDFGLSKQILPPDATVDLVQTQAGRPLGTPAWMPPEQFSNARDATPQSDVFAFGCVAFFLLFGVPPCYPALGFTWAEFETAQSGLAARLDRRMALRADVPESLVALIRRCLDRNMASRPANATELESELARVRAADTHHVLKPCNGAIAEFRQIVEDALFDTGRELTQLRVVPYVADQFAVLARDLTSRMNHLVGRLPTRAETALNDLIRRMNVWERQVRAGSLSVDAAIPMFKQTFPEVRREVLEPLFLYQFNS